jgi:hypothetical protein
VDRGYLTMRRQRSESLLVRRNSQYVLPLRSKPGGVRSEYTIARCPPDHVYQEVVVVVVVGASHTD